jgi:cyclophilin family peptidyl-prolyl cis-trans isomerase
LRLVPNDKRQRHKAGHAARRAALEAQRRRQQNRKRAVAAVIVIAIVVGLLALVAGTGNDNGTDVATDDTTTTTVEDPAAPEPFGSTPCPPADGSGEPKTQFDSAFEDCLEEGVDYHAIIETDLGTIEIDLFEEEAPATVNNFVALARSRAYEDVPFHRVVKDFVIQGGDVQNKNGTGGPGYAIPDELPDPEDYEEGSLAMANSGPNSGGSQFFVVTSEVGAQTLVQAVGGTANYSLFGKVTAGMDVVKKIEADANPEDPRDRPKVEHKIVRVTVEER